MMDRNYREVINLLFVLPGYILKYIFKTEEILQFWEEKIVDVQRKRLKYVFTSCRVDGRSY